MELFVFLPFCDFSPIKNPGLLTGVHSISTWRCPTLTWGSPTLPSAFRRFTSEFGMGSGGTTALSPPGLFVLDLRLSFTSSSWSLSSLCFMRTFIGYKLNFYFVSFYFFLFFFVGFVLLLLLLYSVCFVLLCFVLLRFVSFTALLKTFERCIVKPLGQLVRVSSMAHTTYTPRLSTS